jgi:hypothetical protein
LQVALPRHCMVQVPPLQLEPQLPWVTQIPQRPVVQVARQLVPAAQAEAQMLAMPPPPHVWVAEHEPQLSDPPQLSEMLPQFFPCAAQVVGVQLVQTFATQVWVPEHEPQLSEPPHPSEMVPQFFPCAAQVVGVQPFVQTLETQLWVPEHEPQLSEPPHPSGRVPQFLPCAAHVVGVQLPVGPVQLPPVQVAVSVAPGSLLKRQFPPEHVKVQ